MNINWQYWTANWWRVVIGLVLIALGAAVLYSVVMFYVVPLIPLIVITAIFCRIAFKRGGG